MLKKIIVLILVVSALFLGAWFLASSKISFNNSTNKLMVVASFYPLAHFTEKIGGDRVDVINLTPAGTEPHDFDPSPRDLAALQNSSLFIYNGAGFEPWVERVLPDLEEKAIKTLDASLAINLLAGSGEDHEEDGHGQDENHTSGQFDPHVWLDPKLAAMQVDSILSSLSEVDPENTPYYEENAEIFKTSLAELDREFSDTLASCKRRNIVVSHKAFAYFAKRYNLNLVPISGLSPDEEPSPKKLTEVVDFVRDRDITHIFFETLVSPRLAETIALEAGVKTLVLNPLEGLADEEIKTGKGYISIQMENLLNLKEALNCDER